MIRADGTREVTKTNNSLPGTAHRFSVTKEGGHVMDDFLDRCERVGIRNVFSELLPIRWHSCDNSSNADIAKMERRAAMCVIDGMHRLHAAALRGEVILAYSFLMVVYVMHVLPSRRTSPMDCCSRSTLRRVSVLNSESRIVRPRSRPLRSGTHRMRREEVNVPQPAKKLVPVSEYCWQSGVAIIAYLDGPDASPPIIAANGMEVS